MLPSTWLTSPWYGTLTAFVAVNTLRDVVLSIPKILPRVRYRATSASAEAAMRTARTK